MRALALVRVPAISPSNHGAPRPTGFDSSRPRAAASGSAMGFQRMRDGGRRSVVRQPQTSQTKAMPASLTSVIIVDHPPLSAGSECPCGCTAAPARHVGRYGANGGRRAAAPSRTDPCRSLTRTRSEGTRDRPSHRPAGSPFPNELPWRAHPAPRGRMSTRGCVWRYDQNRDHPRGVRRSGRGQ